MRFLIVVSRHFVSGEGIDVRESYAKTKEEAKQQAYAIRGKEHQTFSKVQTKVVEIKESEELYNPPVRKVRFLDWFLGEKAYFPND